MPVTNTEWMTSIHNILTVVVAVLALFNTLEFIEAEVKPN